MLWLTTMASGAFSFNHSANARRCSGSAIKESASERVRKARQERLRGSEMDLDNSRSLPRLRALGTSVK